MGFDIFLRKFLKYFYTVVGKSDQIMLPADFSQCEALILCKSNLFQNMNIGGIGRFVHFFSNKLTEQIA